MWSLSITKIRALLLPKEKPDRKLMTAALVCAGLFCVNLLLYGLQVAPSAARLKAGDARLVELRRRHAEAVLFKKQKALFAGIKAGMLTQRDMPILVKELVQAARRQHLSVDSIKYDLPSTAGGGFTLITFSF